MNSTTFKYNQANIAKHIKYGIVALACVTGWGIAIAMAAHAFGVI